MKGLWFYKIKGVRTCKRPTGSTEASGCCIAKAGGRSTGSTEANVFDVCKAGGRLIGTTKVKESGFGLSGGVYAGAQSGVLFNDDKELRSEWDTSA